MLCPMRTARLLVIQHDPEVPLGELAAPLEDAGLDIAWWRTWLSPHHGVDIRDFAGLVSLGSFASVTEEASTPWIQAEIALLEEALAHEIPVLGVCFGAQILARAAGGRVLTAPEPEMGWLEIRTTQAADTDAVMAGLGQGWSALDFHFDTFELPDSATVLGVTPGFPQAFRVGSCAWGIQFHIEANAEILNDWMDLHRARANPYPVDFESLLAQADQGWPQNQKRASALGAAFAQQVIRAAPR